MWSPANPWHLKSFSLSVSVVLALLTETGLKLKLTSGACELVMHRSKVHPVACVPSRWHVRT